MGREVRAVLVGFGALGVGRGGVCKVCKVCEGERKGWAVLQVGRKISFGGGTVLVVPNPNLTLDLQLALALALALQYPVKR